MTEAPEILPAISVLIPTYPKDDIWELETRAYNSVKDQASEVIIVRSRETSLPHKINMGFKCFTTDFLLIMNNDAYLESGRLVDLCVPDSVATPCINGEPREFSGHVFCVSRKAYEITGGFDERYINAYFDDDDFLATCRKFNVPTIAVKSVSFGHPNGGTTLNDLPSYYYDNRQKFIDKWGREP